MPGTSCWFQVHDNTPFATLKKHMRSLCDSVVFKHEYSPAKRQQLVAGCFYNAEDVGPFSFNPTHVIAREEQEERETDETKTGFEI